MSHFISLEEGKQMIQTYKEMRNIILAEGYSSDILTLSETFDVMEVQKLLSQAGCKKLRVYFAADNEKNLRVILVAADELNQDMLPEENQLIMERGIRCPVSCPPASALNT